MTTTPNRRAASNPAIASRLQANALVGRVAGSLARYAQDMKLRRCRVVGWCLMIAGAAWIATSPWMMFTAVGPWIEDRFYSAWTLILVTDPSEPGCQWLSHMTNGDRLLWFSGFVAVGIAALFGGLLLVRRLPRKLQIV